MAPRAGTHPTLGSLQEEARKHIAGYKVPRVVTFHDSLPREDTGKIKKRLLREDWLAGTHAPA